MTSTKSRKIIYTWWNNLGIKLKEQYILLYLNNKQDISGKDVQLIYNQLIN